MWQELSGCSRNSDLVIRVNIFYSACARLRGNCLGRLREMMKEVDQMYQRDLIIRINPSFCKIQAAENPSSRSRGNDFPAK